MTVLFNGLRTGFTPRANVFEYRKPDDVISTVISNLLATTVVDPKDIHEVIVVKNSDLTLDVEYIRKATDFQEECEISIQDELILTNYLKNRPQNNSLLVIINRVLQQSIDSEIISIKNESAFDEKVGIEISIGSDQRYWYEDYTIVNSDEVYSSNVVISLFFSHPEFINEMNHQQFDLILHDEVQEVGGSLEKIVEQLQINFDWILSIDYLNFNRYLEIEKELKKIIPHNKFMEPHSIHYGNSSNLNGVRSLLAVYHRLSNQGKLNGIVFCESKAGWIPIQVRKRSE